MTNDFYVIIVIMCVIIFMLYIVNDTYRKIKIEKLEILQKTQALQKIQLENNSLKHQIELLKNELEHETQKNEIVKTALERERKRTDEQRFIIEDYIAREKRLMKRLNPFRMFLDFFKRAKPV